MIAEHHVNSNNKRKQKIKSGMKARNKKQKKEDNMSSPKKQRKRVNLLKVCSEMNKYADDANDKEIIKRFKITITSSITEDISKTSLFTILKKPEEVNISNFSENVQPYIKHYLFMISRSNTRK